MSVGVVAWPDTTFAAAVRSVWRAVADAGCPSLDGTVQVPHLSFVVAEDLDVGGVSMASGRVPSRDIAVGVSGVGVFPGGVVHLAVRPTTELLAEHERIHRATLPYLRAPWPHYAPGKWTPHITVAVGLTASEVARAVTVALDVLPDVGVLTSGGIENGTTGDRSRLSG